MLSFYADLACEWWESSGARTAERLEALVQHFGESNALDAETIDAVQREAVAAMRAAGKLRG